MKKALVLFLILAVVAGGLFAQVGWSGAASGNILVTDFDTIDLNAFGDDYDVEDTSISMKYTNGDWNVSLGFGWADNLASDQTGGRLTATLNYDTGNYGFTVKGNATEASRFPITTVNGYYKFMDGDLGVYASIRGDRRGGEAWRAWDGLQGHWDSGNVRQLSFNYTGIDKLNVGIWLPNVFEATSNFFNNTPSVLRNLVIGGKYTDTFVAAANLRLTPVGTDDFSMDFKADFTMDNVADVSGLNFKAAIAAIDLLGKNGTMDFDAKVFVKYSMDVADGINVGADATFAALNLAATSAMEFGADLFAGMSGDLENDWTYAVDLNIAIDILPDVAVGITLAPQATWKVSNAYLNVKYEMAIDVTPAFDFVQTLGVACKWNF